MNWLAGLLAPRGRLASTLRTVNAAWRHRLSVTDRRCRLIGPNAECGLEALILRGGAIRLSGWTTADDMVVVSDLARVTVRPAAARPDAAHTARSFDVTLPAYRAVRVMRGETVLWQRRLDAFTTRLAAALRLAMTLAGLGLIRHRDIIGYLARGDSASGDRLERILLGRTGQPAAAIARPGLLRRDPPAAEPGPVDIIVPVYDAFDDLVRCLDHLARHTDPRHRITLIDDGSPDPRVQPALVAFAASRDGATVLSLPQNKGFVADVNAGLDLATGHVVLLNTDAFVPAGWLPRLMAPLTDPAVASVTPLSNSAEIASVPVMGDNPVPLGPAALDRRAASFSAQASVVEAPTGVGFCMALARDWLRRVGKLDPVFGRGYGEEVDWCRRATGLGGRHVITGQLFVPHRGGGSFGPEKIARIAANNAIIRARYPDFEPAVAAFKDADPLAAVRLALGLASLERPLGIFIAHRLGGGAEHWLSDERARRADAAKPTLVVRASDTADMLDVEWDCVGGSLKLVLPIAEIGDYLALAPERHLVYSCAVGAGDPLLLVGTLAATLGSRDRFTMLMHDYFPLCPSYNLMSPAGRFCELPEPRDCQACYGRLANVTGKRPQSISTWRAAWFQLMDRADEVRTFSAASAELVRQIYPQLKTKITVLPHVSPTGTTTMERMTKKPVIGVLGNIGLSKGAGVIAVLAHEGAPKLVVFGALDPAYADRRVIVHGGYERGDITDLARKYGIDRWLIPSIWPETFSYTTHEALATGLPVFAFDLGGQGDAVRGAPNGIPLARNMPIAEVARRLWQTEPISSGSEPAAPEQVPACQIPMGQPPMGPPPWPVRSAHQLPPARKGRVGQPLP